MSFENKPGCPMCSIVVSARSAPPDVASGAALAEHPPSPSRLPFLHQDATSTPSPSPNTAAFPFTPPPVAATRSNSTDKGKAKEEAPEVVWQDANFTAYRERKYAVSDVAHFVIVFNLHVPSLYMLSSSDVPLLVALRTLATRLLNEAASTDSSSTPGTSTSTSTNTNHCIGFVTPPWRDPSIPVSDHLHAHAYIGPPSRAGWYRRALAYSSLAWYAIDDLIAEIREETSNNRIRSPARAGDASAGRPIDRVPGAGAREGTASGRETTREAFAKGDPTLDIGPDDDIETGRRDTETRIPAPVDIVKGSRPGSPQEASGAGSRHGHTRSDTIDSAYA